MGFSLRDGLLFSVFASLTLFCSCEEHPVGQLPEVQKEHNYPESRTEAEPVSHGAQTPAAKPTPADFFPENKP